MDPTHEAGVCLVSKKKNLEARGLPPSPLPSRCGVAFVSTGCMVMVALFIKRDESLFRGVHRSVAGRALDVPDLPLGRAG